MSAAVPSAQEVVYQQACQAVATVLADLQITPQERALLQPELRELSRLQTRLTQKQLQLAAFGVVSRGKSAVLNALLGRAAFATGPLHGVTRTCQTADWPLAWTVRTPQGRQRRRLTLQLVDTPGLHDVAGEARTQLAQRAAQQADLILFVVAGDLTHVEHEALVWLRQFQKPILIALNKIDLYPEGDRQHIYQQLTGDRLRQLITPADLVPVAALPKPVPVRVHWPDGRMAEIWEDPPPQIADLRHALRQRVAREGLSLLALNSLRQVSEVRDRLVTKKLTQREAAAQSLLGRWLTVKVLLVSVSPWLLGDLGVAIALDLLLILALCRCYGLTLRWGDLRQPAAQPLRKVLLGGWGALALSEALIGFGPGPGELAWPAILIGLGSQGAIAAASTYLVGQATQIYLLQGAGWSQSQPVLKRLLSQLAPSSALHRIRQEIQIRLGL